MAAAGWTRRNHAVGAALRTGVLALLLTGVVSLLGASAAQAVQVTPTDAPLSGTDFQGGDGDQDAELLRRDWQSLVGQPGLVSVPDPNALDTTFGTGSHENDPENWDLLLDPDGVTPAKANFFNAWTYADQRDDTFLYLAFNREESGGNVFLAFELNQDTRLWTNKSGDQVPCRTTGDLIVSYEIQNDDNIDVIIQEWISDSVVTAADVAGGYTNGLGCAKTGHFEDFDLDLTLVQGAINAGTTITNYLPGAPATLGEELFGEASLNLTDIFEQVLEDPCFSFGQISLHGRSSESDDAALQDVVGPVPLLVQSCTVSGTKYHDVDGDGVIDAGEPTIAGWKLYVDVNGNNQLDAGEPTTLTDADGDYTFTDLGDGSVTIREAPSSAQAAGLEDYVCSFPSKVDANCEHTVTIDAADRNVAGKDFANYKKATVVVEKQTVPNGAAGSFAFTSTVPGKAAFNLGDGGTSSTTVDPGVYTATEAAHPDFALTDVACTGDTVAPNSSDAGSTATFDVQSGETVTCVFTNTRKTGKLEVVKHLSPATDSGRFDLKIDGVVKALAVGHNGTTGEQVVDTGGHTVSESAGNAGTDPGDYSSQTECRAGNGAGAVVASGSGPVPVSVAVTEGSDIVCVITNTRTPAKITVIKQIVSDDPNESGTFDLSVGDAVVKAGAGDGDSGSTGVQPGTYTVSEAGAGGTDLAHYDSSIECLNGEATDTETGASIDVTVQSGDDVVCTITNRAILSPAISVDKTLRNGATGAFVDGPILAHIGDTVQYQFAVTNPGNVGLTVSLADPRCDAGTLAGPVKGGGDADDLLEPGETWTYTCSHVITAADPDPMPNTVTASGTVPNTQTTVTDEDTAVTDILHPGVDIEKTGPATATQGSRLDYVLTVTNPGDVAFAAAQVTVTDPQCDAVPVLTAKNRGAGADPTPDTFEPGDTWLYACSLTTTTQTSVDNVANVTGTTPQGRTVTDQDTFPTTLTPPVLGVISGRANLAGPSRCVSRPFALRITGRQISRAVVFVDGKRVRTLRGAGTARRQQLSMRLDPDRYSRGIHRVRIQVRFTAASQTRARTLRMTFRQCAEQVVRPAFTG